MTILWFMKNRSCLKNTEPVFLMILNTLSDELFRFSCNDWLWVIGVLRKTVSGVGSRVVVTDAVLAMLPASTSDWVT